MASTFVINSCDNDDVKEPNVEEPDDANKTPFLKSAGGSGTDDVYSSVTDTKGNLYVTGYFNDVSTFGDTELASLGGKDAFVAKYNTNGKVVWVKQIGGAGNSIGRCIAIDERTGNIVVAGDFTGTISIGTNSLTVHGQYDTFIAHYTTDGTVVSGIRDGISDGNAFGLTLPRQWSLMVLVTFIFQVLFTPLLYLGTQY